MLNTEENIDHRIAVRRAIEQEQFYRWLVIRLGIASAIALTGWSIYLFIIIKRLIH